VSPWVTTRHRQLGAAPHELRKASATGGVRVTPSRCCARIETHRRDSRYSYFRAILGSTRVACQAGTKHASNAVTVSRVRTLEELFGAVLNAERLVTVLCPQIGELGQRRNVIQ
jgi:hypothetical protein